ncbi:unnamed protein product [Rotaria sp. Silwood2]|nr:unnamed protein product [Rotaria sp. Silwood2]CAF2680332.1 unnamed protein product [Rotaria sp. Silwood2]CAF2948274.1 unnamed protein product [Rotaria sp. Silwood2]CAF3127661.1 unnamed protein product [Rotaria sp. Silwood2]CAF3918430.1 unnamed protein product [Rotaria sp. Silwood2]
MSSPSEETALVTFSNDNVLERPQSRLWRLFHGTHYMIGGLTFITGSCMYFPSVYNKYSSALNAGGWLFTIGSFFFLLADLQEWWYYRVGCFCDRKYQIALETHHAILFRNPRNTLIGLYERAEVGINFFMSACGSAFYLAGSILFIPVFDKELIFGEWFFIIGSAFIYLSQAWKVYRSACTNIHNRHDRRFRLSNLLNDMPALGVDGFAGIGGVFYFIGTILFLPFFNKTHSDAVRVAILFVCGGTSFTLSGLFLQYRHHCIHHD